MNTLYNFVPLICVRPFVIVIVTFRHDMKNGSDEDEDKSEGRKTMDRFVFLWHHNSIKFTFQRCFYSSFSLLSA